MDNAVRRIVNAFRLESEESCPTWGSLRNNVCFAVWTETYEVMVPAGWVGPFPSHGQRVRARLNEIFFDPTQYEIAHLHMPAIARHLVETSDEEHALCLTILLGAMTDQPLVLKYFRLNPRQLPGVVRRLLSTSELERYRSPSASFVDPPAYALESQLALLNRLLGQVHCLALPFTTPSNAPDFMKLAENVYKAHWTPTRCSEGPDFRRDMGGAIGTALWLLASDADRGGNRGISNSIVAGVKARLAWSRCEATATIDHTGRTRGDGNGCKALPTAKSPLLGCTRCLSVAYCSAEHQKQHWKAHKRFCKPSVWPEPK